MKKFIYILFASALLFTSCESYLDRQPDDMLTSESIWEKAHTTQQYLYNVYSWVPNEIQLAYTLPDHYASDEATASFSGRFFELLIHGTNSPMSGDHFGQLYSDMYNGIREATIFIDNVDRCPDSEISVSEKTIYKAEARFMRAYYYFRLMKYYGPVFLFNNDLFDLSTDTKTMDRTPWQELVDFVSSECDLAAKELPDADFWGNTWQGRATQGAALALKARLLLYSARPLFNGQNGTHLYDEIKNLDGEQLFNTTYDNNRWKQAADAAKAVIQLNQYALEDGSTVSNDMVRGLENLTNLYVTKLNSSELIYTYQSRGYEWRQRATPKAILDGAASFGSIAPTQTLVDAFAMANGYYPVPTDYWDTEEYAMGKNVTASLFDERGNYSESGYKSMKNPLLELTNSKAKEKNTMNMFVGREARFYRNIMWSGMQWLGGTEEGKTDIQFYEKGANGPSTGNDYPPTGYMAMKFYDPTINPKNDGNYGNLSWPIFRLGGVYLDYIEALNEYDPSHSDILLYWNKIRYRAGVPHIEVVYPEIVGDKDLQRQYIHRERMVEMCYENQRYHDIRTWMKAEVSNNGYVIGCNLRAQNHNMNGDFWKRSEIGKAEYGYGEGQILGPRVFKAKHYLLPFHQNEINRIPALQKSNNYGW